MTAIKSESGNNKTGNGYLIIKGLDKNMASAIGVQQKNDNQNRVEKSGLSVEQVINSIFDNSEDAVFGVDADGNIGYWNQQCAELFCFSQNIPQQDLHCSDLLCGGDKMCATRCCTECAINDNMKSEKQINDFQLNIQNVDGSQSTVNIGTCYFYQGDRHKISTYFSLRAINVVQDVVLSV